MLLAVELEAPFFLADLVFVQNDKIVTKVVELEILERRDDFFALVPLVKDTKGQRKNGVVGIHRLHTVVTTFIDINDEVAVWPERCLV